MSREALKFQSSLGWVGNSEGLSCGNRDATDSTYLLWNYLWRATEPIASCPPQGLILAGRSETTLSLLLS